MDTWFYHLQHRTPEAVVPTLLAKTLAKGWRAYVRLPDVGELARWDELLWTHSESSFLPHGRADHADPHRQPVLLGLDEIPGNAAQLAMLLSGTEPVIAPPNAPSNAPGVQRTLVLFADDDAPSLTAARALWKKLRAAEQSVTYWKERESGNWEKQG